MIPSHDEDAVARRAMSALDRDLALPDELEAKMLGALPVDARAAEPASAREPRRARARVARSVRGSTAAFFAAAIVGLGAAYGAASLWTTREGGDASAARESAAESAAAAVARVDWEDATPWRDKMTALDQLRRDLEGTLPRDATLRLAPAYVNGVRRAFLDATQAHLEASLREGDGHGDADAARAYLLLGDPARLHAEGAWEADALTRIAAEAMTARTKLPVADLRSILRPHVALWIFLVETEIVHGAALDPTVAAAARKSP
jgi:hypothetical protein